MTPLAHLTSIILLNTYEQMLISYWQSTKLGSYYLSSQQKHLLMSPCLIPVWTGLCVFLTYGSKFASESVQQHLSLSLSSWTKEQPVSFWLEAKKYSDGRSTFSTHIHCKHTYDSHTFPLPPYMAGNVNLLSITSAGGHDFVRGCNLVSEQRIRGVSACRQ